MHTPLRISSEPHAQQRSSEPTFGLNRVLPILGVCLIVVLGLTVVGLAIIRSQGAAREGQARVTTLEGQFSALQAEVQALRTGQPTETGCDDYARQLADLGELLKRGRFALTAEMAYMYAESRQNPPCPEARIGLATLAYAATMNDILSSTAVDQGYSAALRWLEAERRATVNGVPETQRMSLAAIVVQASNVGAWELARRAFLKAWDSGLASAYDLSTISQYYAITRNLGRNLAFKGSLELRKEGIRYLATAHALAVAYGLPNRDACADLRGLGYTDCSQVSPDPLDPVLAAARK